METFLYTLSRYCENVIIEIMNHDTKVTAFGLNRHCNDIVKQILSPCF